MRRDDEVHLRHMLDAAREAMSFAQGRTRADLDRDRMLVLSLVKDIESIGEAAYQIAEATRDELPAIPWADIIGMRHRLVHAYFDINLDVPSSVGSLSKALVKRLPYHLRVSDWSRDRDG
jgi:uncharacterized protein with HEPN domain